MTLVLLLVSGSLYAVGYRRLAREGIRFGRGRASFFAAGLLLLGVALVSPLERASETSFTAHVTQHLLLTLFAPPLLALAAPVTLALRSGPAGVRRGLVRGLRSRAAALLTHPVVGWVLFVGTPFVYHLSSLFDQALRSTPAHIVEHAVLLGTALVYWWPIVGADPSPHPVSYPARILSMFLAMPAMSFLAVAIFAADAPLYPTYLQGGASPLGAVMADQHNGAVVMWLVGNLWMVVMMLVVMGRWKRHDERVERRAQARSAALGRS
ncbi:MAG TPA: cytochrome c oxidase assembly protein [Actinomycetota bacterium]|nr:cytochrome c oxidase assembly protein [Actinomycetota bacterium]